MIISSVILLLMLVGTLGVGVLIGYTVRCVVEGYGIGLKGEIRR